METTKVHISDVLKKVQSLMDSGSLHELDEAYSLISDLINDIEMS